MNNVLLRGLCAIAELLVSAGMTVRTIRINSAAVTCILKNSFDVISCTQHADVNAEHHRPTDGRQKNEHSDQIHGSRTYET